jgi:hypothetical protein
MICVHYSLLFHLMVAIKQLTRKIHIHARALTCVDVEWIERPLDCEMPRFTSAVWNALKTEDHRCPGDFIFYRPTLPSSTLMFHAVKSGTIMSSRRSESAKNPFMMIRRSQHF